MLDAIVSALTPTAGLEAERQQIEADLARLGEEREELRIQAGRLVLEAAQPLDGGDRDAAVRSLHRAMESRTTEIRQLRQRRRAINETLRPPSAVQTALVSVPESPELVKATKALDRARNERQALIRAAQGDSRDGAAGRLKLALGEVETRITKLRAKRAEALVPHHARVRAALAPVQREAAERVLAASRELLAGLEQLEQVRQVMPAPAPGVSPAVAAVGFVDKAGIVASQRLGELLVDEQVVATETGAAA
jgi:hypothetical protein